MINKLLGFYRRRAVERVPANGEPPAPERPLPRDVTDTDFAEVVLGSDRLAVVDFWADWCEPCRVMSAYVNFLAQDFGEQLLVSALDVDTNPATSERYAILGLPTLLFFRAGEEIDRVVGVSTYEELRQRVKDWLSQA